MMTAAVLCSAFGVSSRDIRAMNEEHQSELFLKEVGGLLGEDHHGPLTSSSPVVCSRDDDGDCSKSLEDEIYLRCGTSAIADPDTSATRIQTHIRRYLQQGRYRIHKLQQRLYQIEQDKQRTLDHIQRRKEKKLHRVRKRHDREQAQQQAEYQKVTGIVQYLKRDLTRCGKELENHRVLCRDLKANNQSLTLARDRVLQSIHHKKQQVTHMKAVNDRLQTTWTIQKEAIRHCHTLLREQQPSPLPNSVSPIHRPPIARHKSEAKSNNNYETSSIQVNCVNEAEEQCFHYRLVQDVYTFTARTG